jgi:hypothetical protein
VKAAISLFLLLCLMVIYLPFWLVGRCCDEVGRHAVYLAESIDLWLSHE